MSTINVNLNVQVTGGPQISLAPIIIDTEVYEKFEVKVPQNKDVEVSIQPDNCEVSFLLIQSSLYTPITAGDKKLSYNADGSKNINLEQAQIYLGAGAISTLFGKLQKIKFENKLEAKEAEVVVIEILVGRKAVSTT
jgi:hypothetical protein